MHPVAGSLVLDCEGHSSHGLRNMQPVEPVIAAHLQPKMSLSSPATALPSRGDRFQFNLLEKAYKVAHGSAHTECFLPDGVLG